MSRSLGASGEDAARLHAESRGYRTLARNVRTPFGEIDLVLEGRKGLLVFAEVKSRAGGGFGEGSEAVTRKQAGRLKRAALAYLEATGKEDAPVRFDVFAVSPAGKAGEAMRVEWYEDAF